MAHDPSDFGAYSGGTDPDHDALDEFADEHDPEGPSREDIERFGDASARCPACDSEVYDDAAVCPVCNELIQTGGTGPPLVMVIAGGLVVAAMIAWAIL